MNFIKHNRILLLITVIRIGLYASFAYDLARSDFVKLFSLYTGLFFLTYKILQISKQNFLLLAGLGISFGLLILYGFLVPFILRHPIEFPFSDGILVAEYSSTFIRVGLLTVATLIAGFIPARLVVRKNTLDSILGR